MNWERNIKILDYTDPWDIQIVAAIMSKVANTDYQKDFLKEFEAKYDNNEEIKLHRFNISPSNSMSRIIELPSIFRCRVDYGILKFKRKVGKKWIKN